jgi:hypothetical protein
MLGFLRGLPETLWRATVALAFLAFFVQIAIAVGRSGAVSFERLLLELVVTVAFLALPVGIAWRGKREGSLWYAGGGLFLLTALWKIFFF